MSTGRVGSASSAALVVANISDITSTATELNYTDGVTSAIQTQLDGKQPLDADLTSIAALTTTTEGRALLTLVDPNADRVLFWDDSAGAYTHLTMGTNLTITGTTLNAASGSSTGGLGRTFAMMGA